MTDQQEIEAALEATARDFLVENGSKKPLPGWAFIFRSNVQFKTIGMAAIPVLSDADMSALLDMAKDNPHAFDAAKYLAAMRIAAGLALPNPLRLFAGQVLTAEIGRPVQVGRPLAGDDLTKMYQYMLAVFTHQRCEISLSRNDANPTFNACDAVAEAFTRAGRRTTFTQVKSLCYDTAYSNIRALANWVINESFMDIKSNLEFGDLEK
jgi:hypothetical protein